MSGQGSSGNHLIAYVQRSKITDWKRIALMYPVDGRPSFVYGSNDDRYFAKYAQKGSVLWVIASHPPDPPALIARLNIVGRINQDMAESTVPAGLLKRFQMYKFIVVGDRNTSCFFGHNNASKALLKLTFVGKDAFWKLGGVNGNGVAWCPRDGIRLFRPCIVAPVGCPDDNFHGAEPLEILADTVLRRTVFLSWKHRDYYSRRPIIREFVTELVRLGFAVWWDRVALPGSLALNRLKADEPLMTKLLEEGLRQSHVLVAVASPHYGQTSRKSHRNWTKLEWEGTAATRAQGSRLYKVVYLLDNPPQTGLDLKVADLTIQKCTPSNAAYQLKRWFKGLLEGD